MFTLLPKKTFQYESWVALDFPSFLEVLGIHFYGFNWWSTNHSMENCLHLYGSILFNMVVFIPCNKTIDVPLSALFFQHVWSHFGLPLCCALNNSPKFWTKLAPTLSSCFLDLYWYYILIALCYHTIFHPIAKPSQGTQMSRILEVLPLSPRKQLPSF
jgi:hypothetical protein